MIINQSIVPPTPSPPTRLSKSEFNSPYPLAIDITVENTHQTDHLSPITLPDTTEGQTRQLMVANNVQSTNTRRKSTDESIRPTPIPLLLSTPSLSRIDLSYRLVVDAFDMLALYQKRKRAMSTGSLLTTRFQSIQYFNPEFDPAMEESEPSPVRTVLQERFLEALDASIYKDTNDIVLVLDKVRLS